MHQFFFCYNTNIIVINLVLQNGVRALMLDTYDFKGDVWLCHSDRGKCYDTTAFVSKLICLCCLQFVALVL
jgi:hypothetical protein